MKKILTLLAIAFVLSIMFSACGSRDACPGVGQLEQNTEVVG